MSSSDPLAGISQAVADLTAAVTALGLVITNAIAALQAAAAGNGFSPTEAAALATSLEQQVSAINTDATSLSGATPAPVSPSSVKKTV